MRHLKRTAATFFFVGALALGVAPAATAAGTPAGPAPAALSNVSGQIQFPAYWKKSCRYDMWDHQTCKWIWVPKGKKAPDTGSCYGGYGPVCPGFAVQPRQIGQA